MSAVQATISLNPGCVFIICGDFNLPYTSWSNDDYGLIYCSSSGPRVQCVPEIFALNHFFQLIGVSNHFGGILDLVFSNNCNVLVEKSVSVPCNPYHPALVIKFPLVHFLTTPINTLIFVVHAIQTYVLLFCPSTSLKL
jgi:hypothetical protein